MAPGHALGRERFEAMVEWVFARMEAEPIRLGAEDLRSLILERDDETTRQFVSARR